MVVDNQEKAFRDHLFNIGMDLTKIRKLVPNDVKTTLYICQQRANKVRFKNIAKVLERSVSWVHSKSCDCPKYGYRV